MPVHNVDIAAIFTETADLLEIEAANPFRIRAYRNAARVVGDLGVDVRTVIASDKGLTRMPGIGIGQARRGWLTADNVRNTRAQAELRKLLRH